MKEAKREVTRLEKMLRQVKEFLKYAPEGCLKYQKKGSKTYFYQQYMNDRTKKWDRRYIKNEEIELASMLAQKQYYLKAKLILENNLQELKVLLKEYHPERLQKTYEELSAVRRRLIEPLEESMETRLRKWYAEEYEKNNFHSENLKFETDQGEMVRSKSELIIANILYQHKDEILYKYECPLHIKMDGMVKTIYPDFTILNVATGKVTYWEHAGLMDDQGYANDFVKKANAYIHNDILPGRDVIFTYETLEHPLEIGVVRKFVDYLLCSVEID